MLCRLGLLLAREVANFFLQRAGVVQQVGLRHLNRIQHHRLL